jgi:glycosyltransferase involved in cell wall biosynthesis
VRICLMGKYPPIQGGVSTRNYWTAHGLAGRGHEVHVITNAKEAQSPFRMHMRGDDWERCEAHYGQGSVTVHWTDPVDHSQTYIPMASAFVSKLAGIALRLHAAHPFDVIFSFYLEPYGIAGYLAGQMTGRPHVVRMAGSDAGKLWHHPQLEALYDNVLRSAAAVVTGGGLAARAKARGVDADRIAFAGGVAVPETVFSPAGSPLDLFALRGEVAADPGLRDIMWGGFTGDRPYFGIYGKLGKSKGSFALLDAIHRLALAGLDVGLVALAHAPAGVENRFRMQAQKLGIADRILQLPFLPHWRVPEFIRGCLAVCCLEQDFAIRFHSPIILREVLLCGTCVVAATEVIRKLPDYPRLASGYNCVAIDDINDIDTLSGRLAAIVKDPAPAVEVGLRGRASALELQRNDSFPGELERILQAAVSNEPISSPPPMLVGDKSEASVRFRLTELAAAAMMGGSEETLSERLTLPPPQQPELTWAHEVLSAIERKASGDEAKWRGRIAGVQAEIAVAAAENEADGSSEAKPRDPLFRLSIDRWAMAKDDLPRLVCIRDPALRVLSFDFDVAELISVQASEDFARPLTQRRSHIVAFGRSGNGRRAPLVVDPTTARILLLSDGTQLAAEISARLCHEALVTGIDEGLQSIERLFGHGLISLSDVRVPCQVR